MLPVKCNSFRKVRILCVTDNRRSDIALLYPLLGRNMLSYVHLYHSQL